MRYKKHALIARRNKILPIKFVRNDMTTYSGLTLIDYYLRLYKIHHRLKKTTAAYGFRGDYAIGDILFILLIMILLGAERICHLEYLKSDPLFCRIIRITRIPHRTKVSTALKQFTSESLKTLIELNSELVVGQLNELGLRRVTIDLDGTVISTSGNPTWAFRGYNPVKKGAKSYFPLTAHIGETGHFLTIINRPGNTHDSTRAVTVIQTIRRQLPQFCIRFRADSAFCAPKVINYLLARNISFAIKAPFWKIVNLKEAAQQRRKWFRINDRWSYFWIKQPMNSVDGEHYVIVLRKKVCSPHKHFQLSLFSPDNGKYEYSAVVTDTKEWEPVELLSFISGRSAQENSIGELKTNFAFDQVPTNTYQANSAYLQMSQMAYNLSISIQHGMGLSKKRKSNPKCTRLYKTMEWKTFKFLILNRAGRIAWDDGKKVLEVTQNPPTKSLFEKILQSLKQVELKKAA